MYTLRLIPIMAVILCMALGCQNARMSPSISTPPGQPIPDLAYPGEELDYVAKTLDRYGYLTISGATFIEPDPRFQFNLDLTPRELLERNRIEGSSRVFQVDALDVQVSVQAEMVQNLVKQMSATQDPGVLARLKEQLQAAAFRNLLDKLPANIRDQIDPSIFDSQAPAQPATAPQGSDGGQGMLNAAHEAIAISKNAIAKAETLKQTITAAEASDKDAASNARDHAVTAVNTDAEAAQYAEKAALAAYNLLLSVEERVANSLGGSTTASLVGLSDLTTRKQSALDAQKKARAVYGGRSARVESIHKQFDISDADTDTKLKDAATKAITDASAAYTIDADTTITAEKMVSDAADAVALARQSAAAAGVGLGAPQGPSGPKSFSAPTIDQSRRNALNRLPAFSDPLPAFTGDLDLNLRQLMLNSASDHMTQEMLRWLSYPTGFGPGKRVYLTMATVSCIPGRDTYRRFTGHVNLELELVRKENDNFERVGGNPLVFSMYPFLDTQALDLRSSRRKSLTMAFQLILNGYPAAGNAFLDYARQREQDVHTVTGINAVVGYGTGSNVGFTFSPRLTAMDDPSDINSKPGMILQPQSFPAMVMIVIDDDDLIVNDMDDGADHVMWRQTFRWSPAGIPRVDRWGIPGRIGNAMFNPQLRLSEVRIGKMADNIDRALRVLNAHRDAFGPFQSIESVVLSKRINLLRDLGLGSDVYMGLPIVGDFKGRAATDLALKVSPETVWIDHSSTILISDVGNEPLGGQFTVTIGAISVNAVKISPWVLRAVIPPLTTTDNFRPDEGAKLPVVVANERNVWECVNGVELKYLYKEAPQTGEDAAECGKDPVNGLITSSKELDVLEEDDETARIRGKLSNRLVHGDVPVDRGTLILVGKTDSSKTLAVPVKITGAEFVQDGRFSYTVKQVPGAIPEVEMNVGETIAPDTSSEESSEEESSEEESSEEESSEEESSEEESSEEESSEEESSEEESSEEESSEEESSEEESSEEESSNEGTSNGKSSKKDTPAAKTTPAAEPKLITKYSPKALEALNAQISAGFKFGDVHRLVIAGEGHGADCEIPITGTITIKKK